jgi:SAM-dependent methyltransferase
VLNVVLNALAPVTLRVRGPGKLGMDGDLGRVGDTLNQFAALFRPLDFRVAGCRVLELGPGRTCEVLAAFLLAGAGSGVAVDTRLRVGATCASPERLRAVASSLREDQEFLASVGSSIEDVNTRYEELVAEAPPISFDEYDGANIPLEDDSVDLIVSKSVLEHVDLRVVPSLLRELRRVLTRGGTMVHAIDLRDHMHIDDDEEWLDALTYSETTFRRMFSNRPVSINRLRAPEWEHLFAESDFQLVAKQEERLPLPLARVQLDPRWRSLDERALSVAQICVVAR